MAKSILFTKSFQPYAGANGQTIKQYLANFMAKCGLRPVLEQPGEYLNWLDYDMVFPTALVYDSANHDHTSYLAQLKLSIAAGQPRLMSLDDEYFMPLSCLKQVGLDDSQEYTHVLTLGDTFKPNKTFAKFAHWHSSSVLKANQIKCPMWTAPQQLNDLALADTSKLIHRALYAGYPKPDRVELHAKYTNLAFTKVSYAEYISQSAASLASVMMNSESHYGQATPRFYESAALSIPIWPEEAKINGYIPFRTAKCSGDIAKHLAELAAQSPAERVAELTETMRGVRETLACHLAQFVNSTDYTGSILGRG